MVKGKKMYVLRPAIAMIELIFALVVMGIALLSAPMLIGTATQSGFVAIQQESVNEAASKVNMILSYAWDENDSQTNNPNETPPLLIVSNGNVLFEPDPVKDNRTRLGIPVKSSRTFIPLRNASSSISLGLDAGELADSTLIDDVDDFNKETWNGLTEIEGATSDYVQTVTVDIVSAVSYASDDFNNTSTTFTYAPFTNAAAGGTTNVKNITVTLSSTAGINELNNTIVLRAFTCNIGGIKYAKRNF